MIFLFLNHVLLFSFVLESTIFVSRSDSFILLTIVFFNACFAPLEIGIQVLCILPDFGGLFFHTELLLALQKSDPTPPL